MPDDSSSEERRLRSLWSQIQTAWLQILLPKSSWRSIPTWQVFSERFERCLRRVSFYVSRRVGNRDVRGRIVTRVLIENPDLFVAHCDELEELRRLEASADRLLALEAATRAGA
ncbi:MAG TPA: hypothetical protein VMS55_23580 [Myxococcota bacterium]|nr:hypothetical protein [Myxococcota bacterium]